MEMEEREKDETVAAQAKSNDKRVTGTRRRTASASETPRTAQKVKVCSAQIYTTFRTFANQSKGVIVVLESPKSSEASGGSEYHSTPSAAAFGAAGA